MYRPDTSVEIQKIYNQKIREMTEEERFLRGISLTRFCREICLAGLRDRHPNLTSEGLRVKFFDTLYGHLYSQEERGKIHKFLKKGESHAFV